MKYLKYPLIIIITSLITFLLIKDYFKKEIKIENNYYKEIRNDQIKKRNDMVDSNDVKVIEYKTIYNEYLNAPDSVKTSLQPILLQNCDSLLNNSLEIIKVDSEIIKSDSIYINLLQSDLDIKKNDFNELKLQTDKDISKLKRKLVRTRIIGLATTLGAFFIPK